MALYSWGGGIFGGVDDECCIVDSIFVFLLFELGFEHEFLFSKGYDFPFNVVDTATFVVDLVGDIYLETSECGGNGNP